jgi:hypothetical protein
MVMMVRASGAQGSLQRLPESQDQNGKNGRGHDKGPGSKATRNAHACCEPDRRCGCQAAHALSGRIAKDDTGSQEPNASDNALDNATTRGSVFRVKMLAHKHHKRGPEGDDGHCPHPCGFAV